MSIESTATETRTMTPRSVLSAGKSAKHSISKTATSSVVTPASQRKMRGSTGMNMRTSIRTRVSKAEGLTIAYTLGQLTQLFLHWMCLENNLYVYRQILFCSIAGAVLLVAIIIGTVIGEDKAYYGSHEEREEDIGYHPVEKTYAEYKAEAEAQETAAQDSMEEVIPRIYEN